MPFFLFPHIRLCPARALRFHTKIHKTPTPRRYKPLSVAPRPSPNDIAVPKYKNCQPPALGYTHTMQKDVDAPAPDVSG